MKRKILILGIAILGIATTATIVIIILKKNEKQEENKQIEKIYEEKREKTYEKQYFDPVSVINFGWKIKYRTTLKPGFVWEWAVQIKNNFKGEVAVFTKISLIDENGNTLGYGYSATDIKPLEEIVLITESVSGIEIKNTKKVQLYISALPKTEKTEWIWGKFEKTIEK